jgi:hypothetical protein
LTIQKLLTMNKFLLLAAFAMAGFSSFAQNEKIINDQNAQKRGITSFHAIRISSGIDLYLSQGTEEAVAVSASNPSDRDRIRTEVEGGVLNIYLEERGFHWSWGWNKKLKAYVSCKDLNALRASGGSDVYIEDIVKVDKLALDLSGGSDLKGKVSTQDLTVSQSGGSDMYISGIASQLSVHASGGSDFHGYELVADHCQVEASGGSDIHIAVNKDLNVNASGGSDIYYKGDGVVRESHSSGSSSITKKG